MIRPLFLSEIIDEPVSDVTEWFDKEKNEIWCTDVDEDTGVCFLYCYSKGRSSWVFDEEIEDVLDGNY